MKQLRVFFIMIVMAALAASGALAEANLGLKGAGVELGMVSPQDVDATFGFGIFGDFGTISPQLALEGYADYWSKSEETFGVEASVRDIALGAKTKWMFNTSHPKVKPFAGAGLGIHFLKGKVVTPTMNIGGTVIPGASVSDTSTKFGLDVGGGLTAQINERADFVGEMWYGFVSDINQFSMKVGVLYKLGQ
jgi:hypothetical protein